MQGAFAGRAAILAQLVGRWAAYSQGRRHGRRRPARLAAEPVPPRRRDRADRPPRRVRLCRLPALSQMLHRARRAGQPRRRHRHRQPCAGDGQRRPRARGIAPGGSCSTRAIICSTPPIRPSRSRFTGQEAIELRRWIVGPEGRSRGRRRGLAARLLDVASYDEEGGRALEAAVEAARALAVRRLAAAAGRGRRRSAPVERLLAEVRGTVYARAKAQEAGYGLETELAEPDGALVVGGGGGARGAGGAAQAARGAGAAAGGGARGRARLARFGGAGAGRWRDPRPRAGGARRSPPGSPCWRGSAARATPISSTGWRSSGSTGANMTSASTATGSTRPGRSPHAVLAPADGVLVTSATLRGGGGLGRRRKRGPARRTCRAPAQHFEADSPFDYARARAKC